MMCCHLPPETCANLCDLVHEERLGGCTGAGNALQTRHTQTALPWLLLVISKSSHHLLRAAHGPGAPDV